METIGGRSYSSVITCEASHSMKLSMFISLEGGLLITDLFKG